MNRQGLKHKLIGPSSGTIVYQYPVGGSEIPAGSTVYLYTATDQNAMTTVPDVEGKAGTFAEQMLKAANLNVQFSGSSEGQGGGPERYGGRYRRLWHRHYTDHGQRRGIPPQQSPCRMTARLTRPTRQGKLRQFLFLYRKSDFQSQRRFPFMQKIPANELLAGLTLAEPVPIQSVVTDSRKVAPGCVFVCFPGERVDGHTFAAAAYKNGAEYIIANHPVDGVPAERTVLVPDSARAMIRMASNYRMLFNPKMIGVTGSVGKTTTKEFCYAVLSAFGNTLKTEGNQNNDIGVPNTLFRLDNDTEYAVVEMGMDHAGRLSA